LFFKPRRITETRKVENQPNHRLPFNIPLFQYTNFSSQVDIIGKRPNFSYDHYLENKLNRLKAECIAEDTAQKEREPHLDFRMICDPEELEGV